MRLMLLFALPHMPKLCPLKRRIAQQTKDIPMHRVLPERTAPSQMTASSSRQGDASLHHDRALSWVREKNQRSFSLSASSSLADLSSAA